MENWKKDIINNYRDEQFQQGVEVNHIQCMPYKYGLPNKNKQDIYFETESSVEHHKIFWANVLLSNTYTPYISETAVYTDRFIYAKLQPDWLFDTIGQN